MEGARAQIRMELGGRDFPGRDMHPAGRSRHMERGTGRAVGPASPSGHYVEALAAVLFPSRRTENSRNPVLRAALC